MEIIVNDKMPIFILVYIILPFILISKANRNINKKILEKDTTNTLKGFLVLYVAIHHYVQKIINPEILNPLNYIGFLCVAFFFFMSGYGLTIGYDKDNLLRGFFKKKY